LRRQQLNVVQIKTFTERSRTKLERILFEQSALHLVDPSPWPFLTSCVTFLVVTGFTTYLHFFKFGFYRFFIFLLLLIFLIGL